MEHEHHDTLIYTLPGGYVDARGVRHREIELLPLSGHAEELLARRRGAPRPALVTAILSRCLVRVGSLAPVTLEVARALVVADRLYALLKLREATFGPQVSAMGICPWPDCGRSFNLSFTVDDIPVRIADDGGPLYHLRLSAEAAADGPCELRFRLPDGGDQERIWPLLAAGEEESATKLLVARCVQSLGVANPPDETALAALSALARAEIEQQMEQVGPAIDLLMEGACAECGREVRTPFDLEDFVLRELQVTSDTLYREVHYLAYHYHWSEREILQMSRPKRRRYIAILAEQIEAMHHGA